MSATAAEVAALYAAAIKQTAEQCKLAPLFSHAEPIAGDYTFHTIMIIVSAIATILTIIFSLGLSLYHMFNFVNPGEQKQIVRIVLLTPSFAIFYFFSVWFYGAAGYLQPIGEFYELFAMVAMFYLFCTYITPNEDTREAYFAALERQGRHHKEKHNRGSLRWFYIIWFCVFQVLPTRVCTLVATEIIQARACPLSTKLTNSRLVISAIQTISILIGLAAILRFYARLKAHIGKHYCIRKLVVFKGVIGITTLQTLIFSILELEKELVPTKTVSYLDLTLGIPAMMTCCEMLIFSCLFLWPFWPSPYLPSSDMATEIGYVRRYGFWSAMWEVVNVWDIIAGVFFRYKLIWHWPGKKDMQTPIGMPKVGGLKVLDSNSSGKSTKEVAPEALV